MGYSGSSVFIAQTEGGFVNAIDNGTLPPNILVNTSRNFNLDFFGRKQRGGTQRVGSAVLNTPIINGLYQYITNDTKYQIVNGNDGRLTRDGSTVLKSGMSTTNFPSYSVFDGNLFVCDGQTTPQVLVGSAITTQNITTPALDWTGTQQPILMIPHGRGSSTRNFAILNDSLYYSSLDDGEEFDGGTSGVVPFKTSNGEKLIGSVDWGQSLFLFTKTQSFVLDDSDSDTATWGYQAAPWSGGAASHRLIVKTPNDVIVMAEDGDIYSLSAVQNVNNYHQASIARPAFIDTWIRSKVALSSISQFHATYDPTLRAVKFFLRVQSSTQIDTSLVYFIDRPANEAWAIHDNSAATSGYNAASSALFRSNNGAYKIYTGGYDGYVWELEATEQDDNGSDYDLILQTPKLAFDSVRTHKEFKRGFLYCRNSGTTTADLTFYVDGVETTTKSIELAGTQAVYGTAMYGVDSFGALTDNEVPFDVKEKGKTFSLKLIKASDGKKLIVSGLSFDYRTNGTGPS